MHCHWTRSQTVGRQNEKGETIRWDREKLYSPLVALVRVQQTQPQCTRTLDGSYPQMPLFHDGTTPTCDVITTTMQGRNDMTRMSNVMTLNATRLPCQTLSTGMSVPFNMTAQRRPAPYLVDDNERDTMQLTSSMPSADCVEHNNGVTTRWDVLMQQ